MSRLLRLGPRGRRSLVHFVCRNVFRRDQFGWSYRDQSFLIYFGKTRTCGSISLRLSRTLEARATLKRAVDERGEGGAFGQDEDQAEGWEQDHDRREPPFFAEAQGAPEFS